MPGRKLRESASHLGYRELKHEEIRAISSFVATRLHGIANKLRKMSFTLTPAYLLMQIHNIPVPMSKEKKRSGQRDYKMK